MARRGALTALQAALAGVSGGAQGYIQQRELERKREQEKADRERQQAMDIASLQERGFVSPETFARQQEQQAAQASGLAQRSILGALAPMAATTAKAPAPTAADVNALSAALATMERPAQRINVYGQELMRAETPQAREERLDVLEQNRRALAERDRREFELRLKDIESRQGKAITPYQQAMLSLDRERLEIARGAAERQEKKSWEENLPIAAKTKMAGYNASLEQIRSLRSLIERNPKAVGLKNYVPGALIDLQDPVGAEARAEVEAFAGEIRNQRFGGQLTREESQRSMQFLPDVRQTPQVIQYRLAAAERFLEQKRKGIFSAYGGTYEPYSSSEAAPADEPASAANRLRRGGYQ